MFTYFLLMGILTLYTTYAEKGIFLFAVEKDRSGIDKDNVFKASSTMKRCGRNLDGYRVKTIRFSGKIHCTDFIYFIFLVKGSHSL